MRRLTVLNVRDVFVWNVIDADAGAAAAVTMGDVSTAKTCAFIQKTCVKFINLMNGSVYVTTIV